MKYIEELDSGNIFSYNDNVYLLTIDFKKNGSRLAFSIKDGTPSWFKSECIVEQISLYTLDSANNITPLKIDKNEHTV